MRKYLTVFAVDWQNQFIYRLNFVLWRVRNILRLLMTYFLWRGVFNTNVSVFGYSQNQMLTYVFLVLLVQTLVTSAPSSDNIGGEIGNGELSNYLVKPVSYIGYWFTRDLSSKLLNIIFASVELTLLWLVFQPELQIPVHLLAFVVSSILAVFIFYFLNIATRFVSFWTPENTWGLSFLVIILIETLAGGIFPLDILPHWTNVALQFTPFPYLIYYPIAIFLGKITGIYLLRILFQSLLYCAIMYYFAQIIWRRGLKVYASEGR